MKTQVFRASTTRTTRFTQIPIQTGWAALKHFAILLGAGLLAVHSAHASANNLLANGNFNAGSSGWSTFSFGGGYVSFEIPASLAGTTPTSWPTGTGTWPQGAGTNAAGTGPLYDGSLQLTVGAAAGNAGGFCWQTIAAAPNVQYTLTVEAGAQNWWLPTGEIRLWFLDANSDIITSNFVETCLSVNNPALGVALYDTGVPYQNWTNSAVSPTGTKFIKVELCNPNGTGSAWFDDAYLTAPINPPVIANLYPDGTLLEQSTNSFAFTVTSQATINSNGIDVVLNGVDISSNLVITGAGTTNVSVSYPGLKTNALYSATINVTDTVNLNTIKSITFDTYAPSFSWEAEDYDYDSGLFINSPILSATPVAGSYFGVSGTQGIDFNDYTASGPTVYRPDPMSTSVCGDVGRIAFVNAGVADYNVGYFNGSSFANNVGIDSYEPQEWVNYTRTFPAGTYTIYGRLASGNGPTATLPVSMVTSGQTTSSQTTTNIGIFKFPANGWGTYNYIPMTDQNGNPLAITLSGTTTLRVSAGTGANLNFFILLPADTNTPTITSVYPDGSTLVQGTNKLTFTVSSPSHSIAQSNVVLTLNGTNVSNLSFAGSASSWVVTTPLALNVTNYNAVISVTDNVGNNHTLTFNFDTFNPASYDIEAEDWDFNGGQFIDNPSITSDADPNSYFDQVGAATDAYPGDTAVPPTAPFRFRSLDAISTDVCQDTPTRALLAAQATNSLAFNYNISYWSSNGWLNYTHNYPAGNFQVFGRLAGNSGTTNLVQLDMVGATTTNYLGTFIDLGRGYNSFDWVPLVNTNNNQPATITLNGLATLRTTTPAGDVNPDSYLLVPAVAAPVSLQYVYAAGSLTVSWNGSGMHLQSQTNPLGTGLTGTWSDYPGGGTSPVVIPVNKSSGAVFFRLSN